MRRAVSLLALLAALCGEVAAQPAPFDMSGEGEPAPRAVRPAPPAVPAAPEQAPTAPPQPSPQPSAPPPPSRTSAPASPSAGAPQAEPTPAAASMVPSGDAADRRYLVPGETMTLAGEIASRRWSIFLTAEEAAAARTIRLAYQSSILVAPEASVLRFTVNGQTVIETPVQSPDGVSEIVVEVPEDVLQAGFNTIGFEASMRHRTDCTVQSTYDLWAEIDGSRTFVGFAPDAEIVPTELEDVRAVGFDAQGGTRYSITIPQGRVGQASQPAIMLSQGLAILGGMPNQTVEIREGTLPEAAPGTLAVVLGPASEIAPLLPNLPGDVRDGAFSGFVETAQGTNVLVVSGPSWPAVGTAVERVVAPTERPVAVQRSRLSEPGWRSPDAPLLFESAAIPLADLGVSSTEFSGRRFRTEFAVGVPADFFAEAYGEARLLLDLAYTEAVKPGSHLDIYVNGNIATTLPIGSENGEVLRRFPAPLTMRHFRAGANVIAIEAILETDADAACLPGTATGGDTRFAFFSSTQFQMPDFARISQRPNLASMSGTGFPYSRVDTSVPLAIGETSLPTLSAAATLTARIAFVAGRPIPFDTSLPIAAAAGRDAIFVGPASRVPNGIFPEVSVSENVRSGWTAEGAAREISAASEDDVSLERWNQSVGTSWQRPFRLLEDWLDTRFDLSLDALRLTPAREPPFMPPPATSLIVAQGLDPSREHTWTVVAGRTGEELRDGVWRLAEEESWDGLAGRLTFHDASEDAYTTLPATDTSLVLSTPPTFANLRLVTANLLSERPLFYALILAFASIALGVATGTLTSLLGRHR